MQDLQSIIKKGENQNVEFKSTFNMEVVETLVAFANTKGGSVYIGINDSGKIVGIQMGKETLQKISE